MNILGGLFGSAVHEFRGHLRRLHSMMQSLDAELADRFIGVVARVPGDDNVKHGFCRSTLINWGLNFGCHVFTNIYWANLAHQINILP